MGKNVIPLSKLKNAPKKTYFLGAGNHQLTTLNPIAFALLNYLS